MAKKFSIVKDPASEDLFNEIFANISLGTNSASTKAGNLDAEILTVSDSGAANGKITLSHDIGRVPVGFITTYINDVGVVYDEGTAWTSTQMFVSCSAANAAFSILIW